MSNTLFEDLVQGLNEAISYEKGEGQAKVKTYTIPPIKEYSSAEIRTIRQKTGMTQKTFAYYMGVSQKTVEAWEGGRTHPTGPTFRLLSILATSQEKAFSHKTVYKTN